MGLCACSRLPSAARCVQNFKLAHLSTALRARLGAEGATLSKAGSRACPLSTVSPGPGCSVLSHSRSASFSHVPQAAPAMVEGEVADSAPPTKLPVTLLTGFLGSGKTTLLNNILRNKRGLRVAVIENEFGAIDIDSELVALREKGDDEDEPEFLVSLDNGCACCTVNENFIEILLRLIDRREEFDQVVIETTGLANPHSVIRTFTMVQEVWDSLSLDAVVTLVDAKHIERQLAEPRAEGVDNEALKQIAYADRIVLNKTDLVSEQELSRVESRIRSINRFAELRRTQQANISLDFVLGLQAHSAERLEASLVEPAPVHHSHDHAHDHSHEHHHHHDHEHDHSHAASASHDHSHEHSHDHHHHHDHAHDHEHDDSIKSFAISQPGLLDATKVDQWLRVLLSAQQALYRYKGFLPVKDSERGDFWLILQGVHETADVDERPMQPGQEPVAKLVFIGKDLNEPGIRKSFEACRV